MINNALYELVLPISERTNLEKVPIPATTLYIETTYADPLSGQPRDEKPVIILLPGGPGGGMSIYKNHSQPLAEFAHLIFWDPRGCGKSAKGPIVTYDLDTYIDDVEVIRQKLNIDKLVVLSTSYGSMCALAYAIRYPKNLSALILGSPMASYHFIEQARINLLRDGTEEQKYWGLKLLDGELANEDEVLEFFVALAPLYSEIVRKRGLTDSYLKFPRGSYNWQALVIGFARDGFLRNFDCRKDLRKINVPTLILAGKCDWVNDIELVQETVNQIANSEFHVFDCSHSFASDCNDLYIQTVKKFLQKL